MHLIPELFVGDNESLGLYILVGFFLQLTLDYFSGGIEHGHTHVNSTKVGKFPILIFLSLCLHAFLESTPVNKLASSTEFLSYLSGLIIHKGPIAFILGSLLIRYKLKTSFIWFGIIGFAIAAPLGVFTGEFILVQENYSQAMLAIAIGIILHLSTTILLETNEEHKIHWKKVMPMLAGAGLGLITLAFH